MRLFTSSSIAHRGEKRIRRFYRGQLGKLGTNKKTGRSHLAEVERDSKQRTEGIKPDTWENNFYLPFRRGGRFAANSCLAPGKPDSTMKSPLFLDPIRTLP